MNTFSNACQNSKNAVLSQKRDVIERQHTDIVNAIKKEYGITSFSSLTEGEKNSYKTLLLEMWSPSDGLTKKGLRFLNESKTILTVDSTEEQIVKFFTREIIESAKSYVAGNISIGRLEEVAKTVKSEMDEMHGTKVPAKLLKETLCQIICKEVIKQIRGFKLN